MPWGVTLLAGLLFFPTLALKRQPEVGNQRRGAQEFLEPGAFRFGPSPFGAAKGRQARHQSRGRRGNQGYGFGAMRQFPEVLAQSFQTVEELGAIEFAFSDQKLFARLKRA